jgi:hypothetical protein
MTVEESVICLPSTSFVCLTFKKTTKDKRKTGGEDMTQARQIIKMAELKSKAYQLAQKIVGHTVSQTKHLKKWLHHGLDFRFKSSWIEAIAILEDILARDIVPQLLAA